MQTELSDFGRELATDGGSQTIQQEMYDPRSEFDELEEPSEVSAIGDGRRKTLDAIENKDRLDEVQTFNTLTEMLNAVREISLAHRDGRIYMSPPENALSMIESVYNDLPEAAQREFLNDDVLHRRINAARKAFNRWMGKKKREQEMPSWIEAGPSKYPSDKAQKLSQYARDGKEELDERVDKIRAGAKGAKQRSLQAIGTSVAEQNEQKAQSKMERRREQWSEGDIVVYRSPHLHAGAIVRLNQKSVRVQRQDPFNEGEFMRETVDLDSDHITRYAPDELSEIETLDRGQTVPEDLKEAQRQMLGDDWVAGYYESE